ncbi:MAG: basic amino acid ABC transporter substrate-binding protein [Eubacteriales bacterium]|nr:basic amino acid ABC transporter substrate-binding protein [Eubacteriales bacterium]
MKKSVFKTIGVLALCVSMIAGFTACGSAKEEKKEVPTYKVVFENTFPPFDTTDKDGNNAGFDVDLMEAIGEKEGFKVKFTSMGFDALIPAIKAGNADIIASGMNGDPEDRRKKVDFSDPYYEAGVVVLVKKDNTTIKSVNDLKSNMKVASQTATTGADKVQELEKDGKIAKAVVLDGFDTCVLQLQNGDVNAVLIDKPVAEQYMAKHKNKFKIVGDVLDKEHYAIAVKKGNKELLDQINEGLAAIIKDGTYADICEKWGLEPTYK